jgi:hypothetical protein
LLLFFFQVFFYAQQQTLLLSFCSPTFTSLYFTSFYFFQILRLCEIIPSLVLDHVVQNAQYLFFCLHISFLPFERFFFAWNLCSQDCFFGCNFFFGI